jgi:hypothetical protein
MAAVTDRPAASGVSRGPTEGRHEVGSHPRRWRPPNHGRPTGTVNRRADHSRLAYVEVLGDERAQLFMAGIVQKTMDAEVAAIDNVKRLLEP